MDETTISRRCTNRVQSALDALGDINDIFVN